MRKRKLSSWFDFRLAEIHRWAFENMEGCDEPEWSLFSGLVDVIEEYFQATDEQEEKSK